MSAEMFLSAVCVSDQLMTDKKDRQKESKFAQILLNILWKLHRSQNEFPTNLNAGLVG